MRVEELRNYGKGFLDIFTPEVAKQMGEAAGAAGGELQKELGPEGITKVGEEVGRMQTHDWPRLREHGLTDQMFIGGCIQTMATMKTLTDMVGLEKASEIHRRLVDKIGYDTMVLVHPSADEFKACEDIFKCLKDYFKVLMVESARSGVHEYEIVEDTDEVFQFNVTYCTWHEVAKEFGHPYLGYPSTCYNDELYFPRVAAELGLWWRRTGTLCTGAPACDFRFERR